MISYWIIVIFSLHTLQQVGHVNHHYYNLHECVADARAATGNGLMGICVYMIETKEQNNG